MSESSSAYESSRMEEEEEEEKVGVLARYDEGKRVFEYNVNKSPSQLGSKYLESELSSNLADEFLTASGTKDNIENYLDSSPESSSGSSMKARSFLR